MSSAIVNLFGGQQVDLLRPDASVITAAAIVAGSRQPRFNAHTRSLVSIADHSCRATAYALVDGCSLGVAAALLLHDAAEPLLGDPPGPLKHAMHVRMPDGDMITWSELEHLWLREVCTALLPEPLRSEVIDYLTAAHRSPRGHFVKRYDDQALGIEALDHLDGRIDWAVNIAGGEIGRRRYGGVWRCRDNANEVFGAALEALRGPEPLDALRGLLLCPEFVTAALRE